MTNIIPEVPKDIKNEISYQKDSIISKVLFKKDSFSITVFAISGGQEISNHTATSMAIARILEGKGTFFLKNKRHRFRSNDYFFMDKNLVHAIKAENYTKFALYLINNK